MQLLFIIERNLNVGVLPLRICQKHLIAAAVASTEARVSFLFARGLLLLCGAKDTIKYIEEESFFSLAPILILYSGGCVNFNCQPATS